MGLYAVLWGKNEEKRIGTTENEEGLSKKLLDHAEEKQEECAIVVSDTKMP